jgi:tetratricopeptide (TPR) repeat protein
MLVASVVAIFMSQMIFGAASSSSSSVQTERYESRDLLEKWTQLKSELSLEGLSKKLSAAIQHIEKKVSSLSEYQPQASNDVVEMCKALGWDDESEHYYIESKHLFMSNPSAAKIPCDDSLSGRLKWCKYWLPLKSISAELKRELDVKIKDLEKRVLSLLTSQSEALEGMGDICAALNWHNKAIEYYTDSLLNYPIVSDRRKVKVHCALAMLHTKNDRRGLALMNYNDALNALDKLSSEEWGREACSMGLRCADGGYYDLAEEILYQVVKFAHLDDEKLARSLFALGWSLHKGKGRLEEALEYYVRAEKIKKSLPTDMQTLLPKMIRQCGGKEDSSPAAASSSVSVAEPESDSGDMSEDQGGYTGSGLPNDYEDNPEHEARALIRKGDELCHQEKGADAIAAFEQAAEQSPLSATKLYAFRRIAGIYSFGDNSIQKDYDRASTFYDKALENCSAGEMRVVLLSCKGQLYAYGHGNFAQNQDEALRLYGQALEIASENGDRVIARCSSIRLRIADIYLRKRCYGEALKYYGMADVSVLTKNERGLLPDRIAFCRRMITARSNYERLIREGYKLRSQGDDEAAIKCFKQAAAESSSPTKPSRALTEIGRMYHYKGSESTEKNYAKALKIYKKALKGASQLQATELWNNMGLLYSEGDRGLPKDVNEALKCYQMAFNRIIHVEESHCIVEPKSAALATVLCNMASASLSVGLERQALQCYSAALSLKVLEPARRAYAWAAMGTIEYGARNFPEAMRLYEEALRIGALSKNKKQIITERYTEIKNRWCNVCKKLFSTKGSLDRHCREAAMHRENLRNSRAVGRQ